jgi:K+-sensing histidine kinase KdpD
MLDEAARRRSRGAHVLVATADCQDQEDVHALLEGLELIGDGSRLATDVVLARHPDVVCIDDLSAVDGGTGETRFASARRIADADITVVATIHLSNLNDSDSGTAGPLDEAAVLAFADEIELVDAPPAVLADRDSGTGHTPEQLTAMREQAFAVVAEHADRLLAAGTTNSAERPSILACAPPEPGLEPLIRRAAALSAQLAGDFRVAVVEPPSLTPSLEQTLAGYAALTEQLGGQFTRLGGAPVTALTDYAREHHVTELLLPRVGGSGATRPHMLRELVSRAGTAEVHLLPAVRH